MAGSSSNWFKIPSGPMKGKRVFISNASLQTHKLDKAHLHALTSGGLGEQTAIKLTNTLASAAATSKTPGGQAKSGGAISTTPPPAVSKVAIYGMKKDSVQGVYDGNKQFSVHRADNGATLLHFVGNQESPALAHAFASNFGGTAKKGKSDQFSTQYTITYPKAYMRPEPKAIATYLKGLTQAPASAAPAATAAVLRTGQNTGTATTAVLRKGQTAGAPTTLKLSRTATAAPTVGGQSLATMPKLTMIKNIVPVLQSLPKAYRDQLQAEHTDFLNARIGKLKPTAKTYQAKAQKAQADGILALVDKIHARYHTE